MNTEKLQAILEAGTKLNWQWPGENPLHDHLFTPGPEWTRDQYCAGKYEVAMRDGTISSWQSLNIAPNSWIRVCSKEEFEEVREQQIQSKPESESSESSQPWIPPIGQLAECTYGDKF